MESLTSALGFLMMLGFGLLPGWIALARRHSHTLWIFALTFFFGWTGIGWMAAIVWAMWGLGMTSGESSAGAAYARTREELAGARPVAGRQTSSSRDPIPGVTAQRAQEHLVEVLRGREKQLTLEDAAEPSPVVPFPAEERRIEDALAEESPARALPAKEPPAEKPRAEAPLVEEPAPVLSPRQEPTAAGPVAIGATARNSDWEVTLSRFGPYEEIVGRSVSSASGTLLVAEFQVTNHQRFTGTLTTSSITLEDTQGRSIAASGQTASIEKGFWLTWLQSGQTAEHRAVFELQPESQPRAITIVGLRFDL
jgi:hypothetical protein